MFDNSAFVKFKTATCHAFEQLDTPVKVANCIKDINRVVKFVAKQYQTAFPDIKPEETNDYIVNSFNFYTEDDHGNINGTISLVLDSALGFPDESVFRDVIQPLRAQNKLLLSAGRFVVNEGKGATNRAMTLLQTLYLLPRLLNAYGVIGMVRAKDLKLHVQRFGARLLQSDTGKTYGSKYAFSLVLWHCDTLSPAFFSKTGCPRLTPETGHIYHQNQWDEYANAFGAIQTQFQRELQQASARLLYGDVADFGCGTAKMAPLLTDNQAITSYTGIDASRDMLAAASNLLHSLNRPGFTLWHGKIEDFNERQFDSAVCLNSLYSWPDIDHILAHMAALIKPRGTLVLATPNPQITAQMPKMLQEAEKELLLHPYWTAFKTQNLAFVDNTGAHFIEMDELVCHAHDAGFAIHSCHQSYYLGALNFLVLKNKCAVGKQQAA